MEDIAENNPSQETVQPGVIDQQRMKVTHITSEWQRAGWVTVILMFVTSMAGFIIIGPLIGIVLSIPFVEGNFIDYIQTLQTPIGHPEVKLPLMILQGSATFFGLICVPALYLYAVERKNPFALLKTKKIYGIILISIIGIVIFFGMGINSLIIEWNSTIHFPEALKGFESWAREREDLAAELTKFLTTFDSTSEFIVAFFVIAVFAGIGEELVFRGMLQPQLYRATGNIHVAIWTSAILFSAIHMQFFGFVPRMLLGALFGYLYYWSGSLIVPMFAHFVNNGFSVIMIFLNQRGIVDLDIESSESLPLPYVAIFTALTVVLLFFFKNFYATRNAESV